MADPSDLGKLLQEAATHAADMCTLVKRAYQLGVGDRAQAREEGIALGVTRARAEITRALLAAGVSLPTVSRGANAANGTNKSSGRSYGAISAPVREALRHLAQTKGSASATDIHAHLQRAGHAFDISQVRTALKVMARSNAKMAKRLERGRYTVGPNMPPPPPSADTAGAVVPTLPLTH
jgi:hypothetical protein